MQEAKIKTGGHVSASLIPRRLVLCLVRKLSTDRAEVHVFQEKRISESDIKCVMQMYRKVSGKERSGGRGPREGKDSEER